MFHFEESEAYKFVYFYSNLSDCLNMEQNGKTVFALGSKMFLAFFRVYSFVDFFPYVTSSLLILQVIFIFNRFGALWLTWLLVLYSLELSSFF